ncbi:DNA gyrase inhibitor YacG [Agarivorans sp. OAG1]|uniref:DNA gyrase inhibitor YacG n=1 Tax=Agarivorans albus MKT 106 TaxID=1331007 RepID=R9PSD4_AGAAL|nr:MULTISPECIES: DNA gyrase inhibitor YacG [Agarivorans]MPW28319.1 DNA gyrase inhibitor YacG [Agarivorans sp. B2Z047]UQN43855.1 DNA gyrase inhibitor YacG [Agarivorans sp. B2Z047]BEU04713.1 DNA gyrase inhibitor YacG [Agarivorans sp. OAG1]GAD01026.1 zinc-binding protein [Agarivorans albus MKT 106]
MKTKNQATVKCPTCSAKVVWQPTSEFRPFCSERCKLIDLGEWANEEKYIAGQNLQEDEDKPDSWEF